MRLPVGRFVIAKAGTAFAKIVPLDVEPEKFIFVAMKGLLSQQDLD